MPASKAGSSKGLSDPLRHGALAYLLLLHIRAYLPSPHDKKSEQQPEECLYLEFPVSVFHYPLILKQQIPLPALEEFWRF